MKTMKVLLKIDNVMVGDKTYRQGQIVSMAEAKARRLINRGQAEDAATAAPPAKPDAPATPAA